MLKTSIVIGIYNHLPEGSSDGEFERLYQTCYRPFLSVLNRFPDIQVVAFYSGSLLKRLETRHPEYLMLLEELSARRQLELLGGGFYAPLLPLLPGSDRLGQIEILTTYLRKHFGKRPRGCWLSEYAWEPWLASSLHTCGMDYAFLTVDQFRRSLGASDGYEPMLTEDQGRCITVIPSYDCSFSYGAPVSIADAAEELVGRPGLCAVMMAGETIAPQWEASGMETPDLYLERSFARIRSLALELETVLPSRYLKAHKAQARAYFSGSSSPGYAAACASPSSGGVEPAAAPSLRSAVLASAASSALHAKMYYVHLIIGQLRGDRSRKKSAAEDLWRGQSADAYWLSPVGGIASPAIRQAAYRGLLDAEQTTRVKGNFKPGIIRSDTDFDGVKELIYLGSDYNACIQPLGAAICFLDALKQRVNVCDLFNGERSPDRAHRSMFVDRVYAREPGESAALEPWIGDAGIFSRAIFDEAAAKANHLSASLTREGLYEHDGSSRIIALEKTFIFSKRGFELRYSIVNRSEAPVEFYLGIELNACLFEGDQPQARLFPDSLRDQGEPEPIPSPATGDDRGGPGASGVSSIDFGEFGSLKGLKLALSEPGSYRRADIVYAAGDGRSFAQGSCALLYWKIRLEPETPRRLGLNLELGH